MSRSKTEAGVSGSEALLRAAVDAIESLAKGEGWQAEAPAVLAEIGGACAVSRVHLFRNTTLSDGRLASDLVTEWVGPGVSGVMNLGTSHDRPYDEGRGRARDVLSSGELLAGVSGEFPADERAALEAEGVLSAAFAPVFVGGGWWGYLGCSDCVQERAWPTLELEVLRVIAGILGSAIGADQVATERRKAEEIMRVHIENIPAITYIESTDQDSEFGYVESYVSPQIETILGYTQHEWLNDFDLDRWLATVHPDDRERIDSLSRSTAESGEPFIIEYRVKSKDGRWVWIADEAHLIPGGEGEVPYWHGVMMDITERKHAEEQREFQARLLESISDAVIAYDLDEMTTSWNRASEVLYGWRADEVLGKPVPESIRYDPARLTLIWDPFVEDMGGWRGTTVHQDKDGYDISIETKGLPLLDAEGSIKGYVMVNREAAEG